MSVIAAFHVNEDASGPGGAEGVANAEDAVVPVTGAAGCVTGCATTAAPMEASGAEEGSGLPLLAPPPPV